MLTEVCAEIKNYFCNEGDKHIGEFSVVGGKISPPVDMQEGQYYRVAGSVFNDGVHRSDEELKDESEFIGGVWLMRCPKDFLELVSEMEAWQEKYGGVESANMSPYTSESFGGYAYSKGGAGSAGTGGAGMPNNVFSVFADRLRKYRKIRL